MITALTRALTEYFSNFGSLKSTETETVVQMLAKALEFQQFRLVEEH